MIRLAGDEAPKLGLAFAFSLLLSLVSANAGMKALFDGLNIAYEEREKRSLIKLNLISLGFTLAALVFLLTAFAAVVAVPIALALVGLKGVGLMAVLRWPLLFGGAVLALEVFYRYGPSRERAQWRWITCGSVAGAGGTHSTHTLLSRPPARYEMVSRMQGGRVHEAVAGIKY